MPAKPIPGKPIPGKPIAVFLDFETLGPNLDTKKLEALVDMRFHDRSEPSEVTRRLAACEIAIVNKCDVGGDAIRASKRLKLIALTGTGLPSMMKKYVK